jgi:hypothetical protein
MKKRYLYSLLFGIPAIFVSGLISVFVFGAVAGLFWIYIFGDDPWPFSAERILSIIVVPTFLIVWVSFITIGYVVGKKLEKDPLMNRKHVLVSAGLTIMFIVLIVLQQWRMGNIGPKSDTVLCSDFCTRQGYSGSGMPPKNSGDKSCNCYDNSGNEALTVPLDSIDSDTSK